MGRPRPGSTSWKRSSPVPCRTRAGLPRSLAPLLGLDGSARYPAQDLTPQQRKTRTFQVLVDQLEGLAQRQPVLVVLEDLHWIDPTTRELFDLVIDRLQRLPALLVVDLSPRAGASLDGLSARHAAHPQPLGPGRGGKIGRCRDWRAGAAGRHGRGDSGANRRRALVRGGADEGRARVRSAGDGGQTGAWCSAAARDPEHAPGLAGSPS